VKCSDQMSKKRSAYHWISLGAAAGLLAVALAGCGGSAGGDGGVPAATTTTGTGTTTTTPATTATTAAPVGTAVLTAATAAGATTANTAANPNQAFGLIVTAGAAPITINSPPVVNFTVIDSTGKFVSGLKLAPASAADVTADANCSANNMTFAIAKFDSTAGAWQSLISRKRLEANTTTPSTKYAVIEGTTDPKPSAYNASTVIANPSTALADPTTRVVGILEENTTGGYYTYRFATDVTKELLFADAVAGKNVASTAATSTNPAFTNKIANNGKLAAKDGKTIHRLAAQMCYTDAGTKVVVNPYIDFVINADGSVTPTKTADGKSLDASRKVVDMGTCNECHSKLAVHSSGRVDPAYCVVCHNPGSTDYNSNNPIDFKNMIHKLHGGKNVLTKDYFVAGLTFRKTDATTKEVSGTAFPQEITNCTKCHDNKAAAQADNWKSVPTVSACGSCHDGIDFAKGTGYTKADAATDLAAGKAYGTTASGHGGGARPDDTKCTNCHDSATIPLYHYGYVATDHNPTVKSGMSAISYDLKSITLNASRQPVFTFKITKDGAAVTSFAVPTVVSNVGNLSSIDTCKDTYKVSNIGLAAIDPAYEPIAGFAGGPTFYVAYAVPQDGITAPADFNNYQSASLASLLVASGYPKAGTITGPDSSGYFTATLTGPPTYTSKSSASATYSTRTSTSIAALIAAATADTNYAAPIAVPTSAVMVTGAMIGTFTQKVMKGVTTYVPANVTVTPNTSASGGKVVKAMLKMVPLSSTDKRREIVSTAKCNACHDQLGTEPEFHGGARNDANACAICHNANRTSSGYSADARQFIHGIHGASKRSNPYTWHAVSATANYSQVGYPGVLQLCETCHNAGTHDLTASQYTDSLIARMLKITVATGTFNKTAPSSCAATGTAAAAPSASYTTSPWVDAQTTAIAYNATAVPNAWDWTNNKMGTAGTAGHGTNYGSGFSVVAEGTSTASAYNATTGVAVARHVAAAGGEIIPAQPGTLVNTPIANACMGCHDSTSALAHMKTSGGAAVYEARYTGTAKSEACMTCHGTGKVNALSLYHKAKVK